MEDERDGKVVLGCRGEREREGKGERESRMAVPGGFREEGGTDGGCREGVRKMSQLTELEKI